MNWFGKKKTESSTVSATSAVKPSDPQVTIVKLRESIANQEKRSVNVDLPLSLSQCQSCVLDCWRQRHKEQAYS
jgi:hypothetical protein